MSTIGLTTYMREFPLPINEQQRDWIRSRYPAYNPKHTLPELWMAYLGSLGYTGTLNERMKKWAGAITGNTGSLNDRLYALKDFVSPPVPPGPADSLVAALNNTTPFTKSFNTVSGNIVVRLAGRNMAANLPTLTTTFGAASSTKVVCPNLLVGPNNMFMEAYVFRGVTPGVNTITVSAAAGSSLTDLAVRIGDLSVLPADWQGDVNGFNNPAVNANYEVDTDIAPQSPGNNLIASIVCWADNRAYPITESDQDETEQWNTFTGNTSARFAYQDDMSGQPLFVYFADNPNSLSGAMMLFELKGASV